MQNQIFEVALGIVNPWYINGVDFDAEQKSLSIHIDLVAGSRFAYPGVEGVHPVHDTQIKRYRHLNFFQHECHLDVRVPRIKPLDGKVVGARLNKPGLARRRCTQSAGSQYMLACE